MLADLGLDSADLAGAQRDGEQIGQQVSHLGLAQPVSARQQGAGGFQPGPVLPGRGLSAGGPATPTQVFERKLTNSGGRRFENVAPGTLMSEL